MQPNLIRHEPMLPALSYEGSVLMCTNFWEEKWYQYINIIFYCILSSAFLNTVNKLYMDFFTFCIHSFSSSIIKVFLKSVREKVTLSSFTCIFDEVASLQMNTSHMVVKFCLEERLLFDVPGHSEECRTNSPGIEMGSFPAEIPHTTSTSCWRRQTHTRKSRKVLPV